MKDLYLHLGLSQNASAKEIADVLKNNPAMAEIGTILLNPEKRALYDQTWSTLKTIGSLRDKLGLDKDETWFLRKHPDFAPALVWAAKNRQVPEADDSGHSNRPMEEMTANVSTEMKPMPSFRKWWVVAILIVLLGGLYWFLG